MYSVMAAFRPINNCNGADEDEAIAIRITATISVRRDDYNAVLKANSTGAFGSLHAILAPLAQRDGPPYASLAGHGP
jgi:hypothetical protein